MRVDTTGLTAKEYGENGSKRYEVVCPYCLAAITLKPTRYGTMEYRTPCSHLFDMTHDLPNGMFVRFRTEIVKDASIAITEPSR